MLTVEQDEFRQSVRSALARAPRPLPGDDPETGHEAWTKSLKGTLAGLGGFGLLVPAPLGGSGGGIVDMLVLLEETGRAGVERWFLASSVLATVVLKAQADYDIGAQLLSAVASGDRLLTVGLTEADGIYSLGSMQTTAQRTSDPGGVNGFASLHLDRVAIPGGRQFPVDLSVESFGDLLSYGAVGTCAEMVGGAQRVLEMTVDYAGAREQFGVPIGAFEMVQHHCVGLRTDVQAARVITFRAARALEAGAADRHRLASVAKAWTSRAYRRVTSVAHRVHGAIGFSEEQGLHRYTKAQMDSWAFWGDPHFHAQQIASQL
jgi:3-oxocholest-4-en-26-oyl-CoA dehydrogenase beta subunit